MVAPFLWSGNPRPGSMVNGLNYVLWCLGPRLRRGKGEDVYICTLENLRWISKIKLCKRYLLSKMSVLCMLNVSGGLYDVIYIIYICTHILSKLGEFFSYEKLSIEKLPTDIFLEVSRGGAIFSPDCHSAVEHTFTAGQGVCVSQANRKKGNKNGVVPRCLRWNFWRMFLFLGVFLLKISGKGEEVLTPEFLGQLWGIEMVLFR